MRSLLPCLAALLLLCSCAGADRPGAAAGSLPPVRVLFIGNSYTLYNGTLPKVLNDMAAEAGVALEARGSLRSGKSLAWHYNEGKARAAIARGGWDYVVLQDHSRQTIDHPDQFEQYVKRFDQEIRKIGARTVLFMTWARQHQPDKQTIITRAYEQSAATAGALIAPVGLAWQRVLRVRPDLPLYFDDQSHPTPAGTYLAACVFYRMLLNQPPPERVPAIRNHRTGKTEPLPAETAWYLRDAAALISRWNSRI